MNQDDESIPEVDEVEGEDAELDDEGNPKIAPVSDDEEVE